MQYTIFMKYIRLHAENKIIAAVLCDISRNIIAYFIF